MNLGQISTEDTISHFILKLVVTTLLLVYVLNPVHGQNDSIIHISARCLGKVLEPHYYEEVTLTLPIYFGEDRRILKKYVVDTIIILNENLPKRWVEHRKEDCIAKDEYDCSYWSRNEPLDEELEVNYYLTDTTVTQEYYLELYPYSKFIEKREVLKWMEVVCPKDMTDDLINDIREKLGLPRVKSPVVDFQFKKLLHEYEIKHHLPIGKISIAVLDHMNIPY